MYAKSTSFSTTIHDLDMVSFSVTSLILNKEIESLTSLSLALINLRI